MAQRDLLVYIDQSEDAFVRLHLAADLARRHGSALTALLVREDGPSQLHQQSSAEFGLVSFDDINRAKQRLLQSFDETARRLKAALEAIRIEHGLEVQLRTVDGVGSAVVPQHARFADLCVLGQDVPLHATSVGYTFSEELLFVTGRPVIFVPANGAFKSLGRHLLVAWNSSRACARSVNDALSLIEGADQITVLAINAQEYVNHYDALPPTHIVEHLKRHNERVHGIWLDNISTGSIAGVLQAEAHRVGADLVVAGAFGHPEALGEADGRSDP